MKYWILLILGLFFSCTEDEVIYCEGFTLEEGDVLKTDEYEVIKAVLDYHSNLFTRHLIQETKITLFLNQNVAALLKDSLECTTWLDSIDWVNYIMLNDESRYWDPDKLVNCKVISQNELNCLYSVDSNNRELGYATKYEGYYPIAYTRPLINGERAILEYFDCRIGFITLEKQAGQWKVTCESLRIIC